MRKPGTYPNAPITEAIIQLSVHPAVEASFTQLARCHMGEESTYPTKNEYLFQAGPSLTLLSPTELAKNHRFVYASDEKRMSRSPAVEC